jgi:hypothetical protein
MHTHLANRALSKPAGSEGAVICIPLAHANVVPLSSVYLRRYEGILLPGPSFTDSSIQLSLPPGDLTTHRRPLWGMIYIPRL